MYISILQQYKLYYFTIGANMENRYQYLLNAYYCIDNDIKANYTKYKKELKSHKNNTVKYADTLLFLIRCKLIMGKYQLINENINTLLDIYTKHNDLCGQFFTLTTYGISCRDCMDTTKANKVFHKAHKISYEINDPNYILIAIINYACMELKKNMTKKLIKIFEDAQKYVKKIDNQKIIGAYYINYGYVQFLDGNIKKAQEYNTLALRAYENFYSNKNAPNILAVKSNQAEIYSSLKEYEKAIEMYKEVYATALETNDNSIAYDCLRGLVGAYEKSKNYEQAFKYLKLVDEKLSSLLQNVSDNDSFSILNQYLSHELEESKEQVLLTNQKIKQKSLELEENLKQLNLISTIGKKITSITEESILFETVVDILYANLKIDVAGMILVDEENRKIHLKYFVENNEKMKKTFIISVDDEYSLSAYCVRENKDLFINNVKNEYTQYIQNYGLTTNLEKTKDLNGSVIFCRLLSNNKIIGILTIQSYEINAFNDRTLETIHSISSYVAIALSNSNKNKLLAELSHYDSLTGLQNRRSFREFDSKLSTMNYHSIALIIADMNHLKLINDHVSHLEGDRYLKELSTILQSLDNDGSHYRIGGDEFAIIILDSNENDIIEYIDKIKNTCKKTQLSSYPLSVAIGYSYRDFKETDLYKLFIEAETNMYTDKENYYLENNLEKRRSLK